MLALGVAHVAQAASNADVVVHGALAMPEEVYRAYLLIPEGTEPSPALAEVLAAQLQRFLRDSGYELAWTRGTFVDGKMVLELHEGLLEKIVFRGRLTFNLMRFRVALDLPRNVFNRPALERQIAELSERFGLEEPPRWELIPTQHLRHQGPQVKQTKDLLIGGRELVLPQQDWELHLFFADPEWSTGPGIDVRSGYFDGFEVGPNYQGAGLLAQNDRWRVGLTAGLGVRQDMVNNAFYPYFSRGTAEALWMSPELAPKTRMLFAVKSELLNRQRRDLGLESYWSVGTDATAGVLIHPFQELSLTVGFGGQHFLVFGEQPGANLPPREPRTLTRWRGFVHAGGEYVFDEADGRWDRRHFVALDARLWASTGNTQMGDVRGAYQKIFALGWHDVVLKARGRWLTGDVLFAFEEPVGEYLRAVFGDVWTRAVFGLRGEFRFSLTRDLFKVGLFVDAASYAEHDDVTGLDVARFGTAFGPGFHTLVEGLFQVDVNVSFGVLSTGRANVGLFVFVYKIF